MDKQYSKYAVWLKTHPKYNDFVKIIEKTNLNCLDISHILYDSNPERFQKIQENLNYRMKVETLKKKLEDIREKYIDNVRELRNSNVNKSRIEISKEEEDLLKKYDKDIDNVIKKDKAKYPVFLAKEAIKILDNENNEELIKDDRKFGEMIRKMKKYMMYKRAERAKAVEDLHQTAVEAKQAYDKALQEFLKDYGSFHMTYTSSDKNTTPLEKIFETIFDWLYNL